MTSNEALRSAIATLEVVERGLLLGTPNQRRAVETIKVLQAIIDQRGCEHFDGACTDGKLTTLIDIVVWG